MATNLILATHTYANSKLEMNTIKKNEFQDDQSVAIRKVKVVDYPVIIQPDIGADYNKTVKYFINNHTGLMSGKDLALFLKLSPSTVSAGVGSYVDGFLYRSIRRIRLMSSARELFKMNSYVIYQYLQRASAERKEFLKQQARIGATGADIAINASQAGCILIPNPFTDFNPLKVDLLRDRPYFEIEFEPLTTILKSTLPATMTGYIQEAYICANYLQMAPNDKGDVMKKDITQNEYLDYVDYSVASGSTSVIVDIPFNESEYLGFYIEDTTTNQPFTGVSTISDYNMSIDNKMYPEATFPASIQALQQVQFFRRKFDNGVYTLRFTSYNSRDDEHEDYHNPYGSIVLRSINNPKLQINFTSPLANNCVLHIYSFGRAWYKYQDGELMVEQKN